jgi:hypothetical protein
MCEACGLMYIPVVNFLSNDIKSLISTNGKKIYWLAWWVLTSHDELLHSHLTWTNRLINLKLWKHACVKVLAYY